MAFKLIDRVTPVERAYIEARYYGPQVAMRSRVIAAYERCIELDPAHAPCRSNLGNIYQRIERFEDAVRAHAGVVERGNANPNAVANLAWSYTALGKAQRGLEETLEYLKAHPDIGASHRNVGLQLSALGRHDEALRSYQQARLLESGDSTNDFAYSVGQYLRRDWTSVREVADSNARSSDPTRLFHAALFRSLIDLRHGRSAPGIAAIEASAAAYRFSGPRAVHSILGVANGELARGNVSRAVRAAERAVAAGRGTDEEREAMVIHAWTLAAAARRAEANAIADQLERSIDDIALVRDRRNVSFARGLIALASGETENAVTHLQAAQDGLPPNVPHVGIVTFHMPVWAALGRALYEAKRGNDAVKWFKRITDSSYEYVYHPIEYVRSFYYLGKIYEQQGDMTKARENYARFVGYWKDGDLDRDRVAEAQKKIAN
jgi:tetratricopeptide (TPR) repeat protein